MKLTVSHLGWRADRHRGVFVLLDRARCQPFKIRLQIAQVGTPDGVEAAFDSRLRTADICQLVAEISNESWPQFRVFASESSGASERLIHASPFRTARARILG